MKNKEFKIFATSLKTILSTSAKWFSREKNCATTAYLARRGKNN